MSVHDLAIATAKIDIFRETAKSVFTSINTGRATSKIAESSTKADGLSGVNIGGDSPPLPLVTSYGVIQLKMCSTRIQQSEQKHVNIGLEMPEK